MVDRFSSSLTRASGFEETDLVGERLDDFMQDSLTVDCMQACLRGG